MKRPKPICKKFAQNKRGMIPHYLGCTGRRSVTTIAGPAQARRPIDSLEMNCDVVGLDRAVIGEHGTDSQDLEGAALQIIHVSAEDVVRFALEFRSRFRCAFLRSQQFCVETVGACLAARVLLEELHAWIVGGARLWLIVKPASRRQQNEQQESRRPSRRKASFRARTTRKSCERILATACAFQ